jgi:hypothetical protein
MTRGQLLAPRYYGTIELSLAAAREELKVVPRKEFKKEMKMP